eukprot:jgi/Astpho2/7610/e_gw1.00115.120.1_t
MRCAAWLLLTALMCQQVPSGATSFQVGEFVPASRRAQVHGKRTHWQDLLGRNCPHFGEQTVAVVPLGLFGGLSTVDKYKVSFSFDGERLVTPWLTLIGKHAPAVPMLEVELTYSAAELVAAKAKVVLVPPAYLQQHALLVEEFRNSTHWPKHLLVRYQWVNVSPVEALKGLYVVSGAGILASMVIILSVIFTYQEKLQQFMAEIAGDDTAAGSRLRKAD